MEHSSDEYIEFDLWDGKLCKVDKADFELVMKYSWRWSARAKPVGSGYVVTTTTRGQGPRRTVSLHRLLLNPPADKHVDHVNGDRLDNRRVNLRLASRSQNMFNVRKREGLSSIYKGVSWNAQSRKWQAQFKTGPKNNNLGLFDDEVEAAIAYDIGIIPVAGEFAVTNFPVKLVEELCDLRSRAGER